MHLKIVKKLKTYNLSENNELLLLCFCHYLVNLDEEEMDLGDLASLFNNTLMYRSTKRLLQSGNHELLQKGIIQNVNDGGFKNAESYSLTDKAKDELLSELEDQHGKKPLHGITAADKIAAKQMFYPEKTARQVAELTDLLKEENFTSVQKRLSKDGMRIGFACLFSGGPGTGKTETVYQIARLTGRGIMQVDISDTKSLWFGESEKKIKKIFNQYRNAVKRLDVIPIFLLNEADAVISKRKNLGETGDGPAQTENAIQNIILQEIENLNGILIATTNFAKNMDKAFERRFIYKIEFEKPNQENRKSIWLSIIPTLTNDEADILAAKFDFSGGQIENIARRRTVAEILNGSPPSLEKLIEYCKEEMAEETVTKKIGF